MKCAFNSRRVIVRFAQQLHLKALGSCCLPIPTILVLNSPFFGLAGVTSFDSFGLDSVSFPGMSFIPSCVWGFADTTSTEFVLPETTSEDFGVLSGNSSLSLVSGDDVASGTSLVVTFGLCIFASGDDVAIGFSPSGIVTSVASDSAVFDAVIAHSL